MKGGKRVRTGKKMKTGGERKRKTRKERKSKSNYSNVRGGVAVETYPTRKYE